MIGTTNSLRRNDATTVNSTPAFWRSRIVIVCVVLLIAPLSFLYVNQTSNLAAAGYDVALLQGEKKLWLMRNEQLQLDIAKLESLDRIDQLASTKLGMGPPDKQIFVHAPRIAVPPPDGPRPSASENYPSSVLSTISRLLGRP